MILEVERLGKPLTKGLMVRWVANAAKPTWKTGLVGVKWGEAIAGGCRTGRKNLLAEWSVRIVMMVCARTEQPL